MFLAGSFLIFISEESVFTDFDSLLGLLVVIQSSFILSDIGSFIFQKVAFMERAEELGYYKKTMAENPGHFLLHGSHYLYLNLIPGCNRSVGDGLLNRDKHGNPGIFYQYSYVKVNVYTATDKGVFFWRDSGTRLYSAPNSF